MAKMASWLTPLLPDQELAATLTLTTMSSGPLERDKVGGTGLKTHPFGRVRLSDTLRRFKSLYLNFPALDRKKKKTISAIWKPRRKGKSLLRAFTLRTLAQIV